MYTFIIKIMVIFRYYKY